jgi:hypothetical protein
MKNAWIGLALMTPLAISAPAHAQAPAEIPALSRDYAEDLLSYFSWALDIKFTEAEKARFIKERLMEWESGNSNWQCLFIGEYWALLTLPKERLAAYKDSQKKILLDFVIANAKAGQPDCIWLQKRLGQDDEIDEFPASKGRRAPLEKLSADTAVDTMKVTFVVTIDANLTAFDVAVCLSKVSMMLQTPFTPEQRQEFVERAKKHWRKYRDDWGSQVVTFNKNPISFVNDKATFMVYKNSLDHNEKAVREFAERGERDALWLMKIYDSAWHRTALIPSEPALTRRVVSDYAALRAQQINQILGTKAAVADVAAILQVQKEVLAKWASYSPAKRAAILAAPSGLSSIYQVYPHFAPLYQEYQKHLWGQEMVASIPQLKPIVDARAKEFAAIAKKNPNWKAEMEANNQATFQAFLQRNEEAHQRLMKQMDRMYDSVVFSGKMAAAASLIRNAPNGTTVHVDIRP